MTNPTQSLLSMEQQFTLRKYAEQIKNVSRNELEDLFLEAMRQKMAQENVFKRLMRQDFPGLPVTRNIDCGGS